MQRPQCRFDDSQALNKLIGTSACFRDVIRDLPAIARSGATVLILGETGTGKELVARALHYLSQNHSYPFVAVNCGSLSETLLEDELFGHERGSYTDAHSRRTGLVAQADKGTLFLDEIDSLPAKAQVDLLRVLQDCTYRPLGSITELRANLRVVAASNASLEHLVPTGRIPEGPLLSIIHLYDSSAAAARQKGGHHATVIAFFGEAHASVAASDDTQRGSARSSLFP
jgi:DNA-binding NtrC family response regulator